MMRNRNQLVSPINYEVLIDENDPVWKLVEICDTLDYTRLYDEYPSGIGERLIPSSCLKYWYSRI